MQVYQKLRNLVRFVLKGGGRWKKKKTNCETAPNLWHHNGLRVGNRVMLCIDCSKEFILPDEEEA